MTKPTGKKLGRPPKLPEFVVRLGADQEKWDKWLHSVGLPREKGSTKELLCETVGERDGDSGFTQQTDFLLDLHDGAAADESVVLSAPWVRYLEYMSVIAEARSPKDKGAELNEKFMEDARSRNWEQPPTIPAQLGTPADFKANLDSKNLEIRFEANRREHVVRVVILPIPPDTEEDLDESEGPKGHWERLTWFPDRPQ
jgi:hypothetical protein